MTFDPTEAPEGYIAVEHPSEKCASDMCALYRLDKCSAANCSKYARKDKSACYFVAKPKQTEAKPMDTKPMEDEYEYLVADSAENCKTIAEWVFDHEAEVMQHSMSGVGTGHWIFTIALVVGKEYRRKKPQTDVLLTPARIPSSTPYKRSDDHAIL